MPDMRCKTVDPKIENEISKLINPLLFFSFVALRTGSPTKGEEGVGWDEISKLDSRLTARIL